LGRFPLRPERSQLPILPISDLPQLFQNGELAPVAAVEHRFCHGTVYNFRVAELECYAVGRSSVLVHNSNGVLELPDPDPSIVGQAKAIQEQLDYFKNAEEQAVQAGMSKDMVDKLVNAQRILQNALKKTLRVEPWCLRLTLA
jgi:hypothetical protein